MMPSRALGQYSLVSYVHQTRGERVNLGVVVWHPRFGWRFAEVEGDALATRVGVIDPEADFLRVGVELAQIRQAMRTWKGPGSPLPFLASRYRFGVTVSEPRNCRVVDVDFSAERLAERLLLPPLREMTQ